MTFRDLLEARLGQALDQVGDSVEGRRRRSDKVTEPARSARGAAATHLTASLGADIGSFMVMRKRAWRKLKYVARCSGSVTASECACDAMRSPLAPCPCLGTLSASPAVEVTVPGSTQVPHARGRKLNVGVSAIPRLHTMEERCSRWTWRTDLPHSSRTSKNGACFASCRQWRNVADAGALFVDADSALLRFPVVLALGLIAGYLGNLDVWSCCAFQLQGRVRTKTVKRASRVLIEKYYPRLTLDFQ